MTLYRVTRNYADDPESNSVEYLTDADLVAEYPYLTDLVTESDLESGMFSLNLVSGLSQLVIEVQG